MIKYIGEMAKNDLRELLNDILKNKELLRDWNTDKIMPMLKKGTTSRGITLTSVYLAKFLLE
jgi:hypothetical protein